MKPLTEEQILEVGKRIGNGINGMPEHRLITPEGQAELHMLGRLTVQEMTDPELQEIQRVVPSEVDEES